MDVIEDTSAQQGCWIWVVSPKVTPCSQRSDSEERLIRKVYHGRYSLLPGLDYLTNGRRSCAQGVVTIRLEKFKGGQVIKRAGHQGGGWTRRNLGPPKWIEWTTRSIVPASNTWTVVRLHRYRTPRGAVGSRGQGGLKCY